MHFYPYPKTPPITPFHTKNNYILITFKEAYLQTPKINLTNLTNKKKQKIYDQSTYTKIILKKLLLFFFKEYKNEQKENKF